MYTVQIIANAGCFASGEMEAVEEEFETLEEAQEFAASFTEDDLYNIAIEHIQPEAYIKIFDEDGEEIG
jgi:hypothetical protein